MRQSTNPRQTKAHEAAFASTHLDGTTHGGGALQGKERETHMLDQQVEDRLIFRYQGSYVRI